MSALDDPQRALSHCTEQTIGPEATASPLDKAT